MRANTTTAEPVDSDKTGGGQGYLINGHKVSAASWMYILRLYLFGFGVYAFSNLDIYCCPCVLSVSIIMMWQWFTSAPMCDAFLTLSKVGKDPKATPTCFLVPRWLPDGSRNLGFRVMRLKDKLADRYIMWNDWNNDKSLWTLIFLLHMLAVVVVAITAIFN